MKSVMQTILSSGLVRATAIPILLAAISACGGGKTPQAGPGTGGEETGTGGDQSGAAPAGEGAGAVADSPPKTASTVTKHEFARMANIIENLRIAVIANDVTGFPDAFLDFAGVKSIMAKFHGGEDKWRKQPEQGGKDDIELNKEYRKKLAALYEGFRDKGACSDLGMAEFRSTDSSEILLTDTVLTELDKNMIAVVAAFKKGESILGILRLRFASFRNEQKIFYVGDEKILSPDSCSETAAIETLKAIHRLEAEFASSRKADLDKDGKGEFGFNCEIAGVMEIRGTTERAPIPGLSRAMREVTDPNGMAIDRGYIYRIYLPGRAEGVAQDDCGGSEPAALTDARETAWCCYAWPVSRKFVRGRTLVIGPGGTVYASASSAREGLEGYARAGDAFAGGAGQAPAGRFAAADGKDAADGGLWTRVD